MRDGQPRESLKLEFRSANKASYTTTEKSQETVKTMMKSRRLNEENIAWDDRTNSCVLI